MKPFAESCETNKAPILAVIAPLLQSAQQVLEIASGTGQHAVHFAAAMPHLHWQTSDVVANHQGIQQWLDEAALANVAAPLALDVKRDPWPTSSVDAVFSANSVHIMAWDEVESCFAGIGEVLNSAGLFLLYGPFNYNGQFTSESNARFDQWLKQRNPHSGVRDVADLDRLATQAGMQRIHDYAMPVNNRILVWQKQ